jgi:hypothetical protein
VDTDATIQLPPDNFLTPEGSQNSISYSEVIASAWDLFTKNLFKLFSFFLIPYIIPLIALIPAFAAYKYVEGNVQLQQEIFTSLIFTGLPPMWVIISVMVFILVFGVVWIILQTFSLAAMIITTLADGHMSIRQAYRESRPFFWRYLALTLVTGLISTLYLPLLIIPSLVIAVYFSISMPVFIAERTTVKQAILRSFTYIQGNFWKVLGIFATWAIVALPIGMILDAIVENSEVVPVIIIAMIIRFLLSLIFGTLFVCLATSVYKAIKAKKPVIEVTVKMSYFVYPAILGLLLFIALALYIISLPPVPAPSAPLLPASISTSTSELMR